MIGGRIIRLINPINQNRAFGRRIARPQRVSSPLVVAVVWSLSKKADDFHVVYYNIGAGSAIDG